jgi:hypothetical protein
MCWPFTIPPSSKDLSRIGEESFWDGFMGAGLFGNLGVPTADGGREESPRYTKSLAIGSTFLLLFQIGGIIFLYRSAHHHGAFVLIGFLVFWVYAGYDRSHITR